MKKIFLFLLLFISSLALTAQVPTGGGTSSKKADKSYQKAQEAIKKRDFERGMQYLRQAVEADPNFFEAHYSLGTNYHILRDAHHPEYTTLSAYHLREAARILPRDARYYVLYYQVAQLDYAEGKYAEAQAQYEKFLAYAKRPNHMTQNAKRHLASCQYAQEGIQNRLDFDPQPLPTPLNQLGLQYFPVLTGDGTELIFTGRRSPDPRDDEDIYITRYHEDQKEWTAPTVIAAISSPFNEGTCSISADGQAMVFTICEGNRDNRVPNGNRCDLFITRRQGTRWTSPQSLGSPINTKHWESQPALSADGQTLYFVSDRPGGQGQNDIWVSQRQADDTWSLPQNLGPTINTAGDEVAPFLHANRKTLFFSSDGHLGYGALDIFKTELQENQQWQKPQNLGYPINNHRNQVGLFVIPDGKTAYYSDEKIEGGRITSSILHRFDLPEAIRVQTPSRYVRGTIYDAQTRQPIEASVALYDLQTERIQNAVRSDATTGRYLITRNEGSAYALHVNREGYLFKSVGFDASQDTDVVLDVFLDPILSGAKTILKNIFFETARWEIEQSSRTELKLLVEFLQNNPELSIEVGGHTDNVGSPSANQVLSEKRANAVRDFLYERGIAPERIQVQGYGETAPLLPNDSPENRAKNRRIEFKIL
ncbi:MAG: OmpA family protein [Bernardetiaceae bacterium]